MRSVKKKTLVVIVIFIAINILYQLFLKPYVTISFLKQQRDVLRNFVTHHYRKSVFLFIAVYILSAALSIPLTSFLSVTGGYLFKVLPGVIYVIFSATIGAILAFTAIRFFLKNQLTANHNGQIVLLKKAFAKHGVRTLLILRLIPLLPFFLVNLVAALTDISLITFVWTTFVGILPASLVFTFFGNRLDTIHSVHDIFSVYTLLALLLVLIVIIAPFFLKWLIPGYEKK